MKAAFASIRHNLTQLLRFSGSDTRLQFWPYAGLVLFLLIITITAVMASGMADSLAEMQRFANEHPELATVRSGPTSYSISIEGHHPELMPDMAGIMIKMNIAIAIAVALLAASVARRLHDRGKSGWWGVLPIPFLVIGSLMMPGLFGGSEPALGLFFVVFINNLLYIASLILLLVLLVGASVEPDHR